MLGAWAQRAMGDLADRRTGCLALADEAEVTLADAADAEVLVFDLAAA